MWEKDYEYKYSKNVEKVWNCQVNMKVHVICAALLTFSCSYSTEAAIECLPFHEYGNVTAPLIGVRTILNRGSMPALEFPGVSMQN